MRGRTWFSQQLNADDSYFLRIHSLSLGMFSSDALNGGCDGAGGGSDLVLHLQGLLPAFTTYSPADLSPTSNSSLSPSVNRLHLLMAGLEWILPSKVPRENGAYDAKIPTNNLGKEQSL